MSEIKKDQLGRVGLVFVVFLLISLFVIFKVVQIQWIQGDKWREKFEERTFKFIEIDPVRGNIETEKGELLSTNIPLFDVRIDIGHYKVKSEADFRNKTDSLDLFYTRLYPHKKRGELGRQVFNMKMKKLPGRRNYLIKRNASYKELQQMKSFPILKEISVMQVEKKTKRVKPFGELAARTLGFVNKKAAKTSYVGLEGAYDTILEGKKTSRLVKNLARGYWVDADGKKVDVRGCDIVTSLDMNIQDVAHSALKRQLIAQQAGHGSAIVMEVETGKVLAIANLKREANGDYSESYNYAVGEASEPGSTFKLASIIVALEDGVVDTSDMIKTGNGERRFANRIMRDSHRGGYGTISVVECFEKSSNVGISSIIYDNYRNDPDRFVNGLYNLGLNQKLGIEIKGEGAPLIRNTEMEGWSKVSLPWMSIGYEVALTPLQILTFYNGIANDGVMMKPQFISSIEKSGQLIESYPPEVLNDEMCSQSTIDKVKKMMEGVVDHGTASNLSTSIYKIAGKTGTAQLAQGASGYNKKDYKASFVGYFPAENPKYSCIISINEPSRGVYYGNRVAGVAFKEIADRLYATRLDILEYEQEPEMAELKGMFYQKGKKDELYSVMSGLNLPVYCVNEESEWVVSMPDEGESVKLSEVSVKEGLVPNVKGMSVKDAVYLLEKAGMIARFNGRGHVKSQSIKAGTRVKKGMKITLKLV